MNDFIKRNVMKVFMAVNFTLQSSTMPFQKLRFNILKLTPPQSYDDHTLLCLFRWQVHQLEKATKHPTNKTRGVNQFNMVKKLLVEISNRNIENCDDMINWGENILSIYKEWKNSNIIINKKRISEPVPNQNNDQLLDTVSKLMKKNCSVRFWKNKKVDNQDLEKIIENATQAASSCNKQGVFISVLKREKFTHTDIGANNNAMLSSAPAILYFSANRDFYPEIYATSLDVGLSAQNAVLTAESMGLKGCFMYHSESFNQSQLRQKLALPKSHFVYLALLIGYPDDAPVKPPRLGVNLMSTIACID